MTRAVITHELSHDSSLKLHHFFFLFVCVCVLFSSLISFCHHVRSCVQSLNTNCSICATKFLKFNCQQEPLLLLIKHETYIVLFPISHFTFLFSSVSAVSETLFLYRLSHSHGHDVSVKHHKHSLVPFSGFAKPFQTKFHTMIHMFHNWVNEDVTTCDLLDYG